MPNFPKVIKEYRSHPLGFRSPDDAAAAMMQAERQRALARQAAEEAARIALEGAEAVSGATASAGGLEGSSGHPAGSGTANRGITDMAVSHAESGFAIPEGADQDAILESCGLGSVADSRARAPAQAHGYAQITPHPNANGSDNIESLYADLIAPLAAAAADYSDHAKCWVMLLENLKRQFPDDAPLAVRLRQVVWNRRKAIKRARKAAKRGSCAAPAKD